MTRSGAAAAVDGRGGATGQAEPGRDVLNQRIRGDIERKILSGEWGPGHRIPFEVDLAAQYGCSRMTVNKVLSRLAENGLIDRRRRAGTFVSRPRAQSAVLEIPDIRAAVEGRGEAYRYELLARTHRRGTEADRALLRAEGPVVVLALACRHLAGEAPFAYEERLLSASAVPQAAAVDFARVAPGAWLLEHVPWTEAEHRIRALAAGPYARHLAVEPATACLSVERRTWREGLPITHVRQVFPGDLYDLSARFAPSRDAGPGA